MHVITQLNAWSRSRNCRFARCGAAKSYSEPLRRVSVISPPLCTDSHGRRCVCQNEISGSRRQRRRRGLRRPPTITSFTRQSPPASSLSMAACPPATTTRRLLLRAEDVRGDMHVRVQTPTRKHSDTKCDTRDCICRPKGDGHRSCGR